jgi:polyvinyl alcohol dehydrogenase (cytochrome)
MSLSKNSRAQRRATGAAAIGAALLMLAAQPAALAQETKREAPASKQETPTSKQESPASAGAALYKSNCASCHDHSETTRALPRETMAQMPAATILFALTEGKMKAQGAALSEADRNTLVGYITGGHGPISNKDEWSQNMLCAADKRTVDLKVPPTIGTFGYDLSNTRSLTSRQAGLTKAQLSNLELAWAIAIPGGTTMRSQPSIVGSMVFMPAPDAGAVYAFEVSDSAKPCIRWIYRTQGNSPLRSSVSYGVLADGRQVLAVAGFDTTIHLLDAKSGTAIWTRKVGTYSFSLTTGTPVVLADRIIVPVSQYEITVGGRNDQVCCNNHGYVLSLSPKDGSQQWRYDTMPDATPVRDRGDGKMLYGPSGAPIWNSPAIDLKRRLIYVGTGEANSPPTHKNTDAIIAIGLDDGKERWSFQATSRDIYLVGCGPDPKPAQLNCVSDTVFRDVDFGASMIIGHTKRGQDAVFAGQKSGAVWAMDPSNGQVLWRQPLGTGSALGGVHWGIALAEDTIFAPISLVGTKLPDESVDVTKIKSGIYALNAATGEVKWVFATASDCEGDRRQRVPSCGRMYGVSSAPTVIDGAVIAGALDGYLYVLDAKDGKQLWKFDTAISVQGINGVAGKGGSIDAASISAGNGLLFVNSGYGMFGQTPGNLTMAFRPKAH